MNRIVLVAAPSAPAITLSACKTMLGLTGDTQDGMIEAAIGAVVSTLDPASGGWLGRALRPQTWELRLDGFPGGEIELPYPVLTALTSVKYDDSSGVETTLVEGTDYRVFGLNGHTKASIAPVYNGSWPAARADTEAVRIRYVSGYAGNDMPKALSSAIALGVRAVLNPSERNLYLSGEDIPGVRSRSWVVSETAAMVIERAIGSLLSTYRVWG